MRRVMAIALALLLATAGAAAGGAWLREDGRLFLSVKTTLRHTGGPVTQETDLYADYGLRPRLSLGAALLQKGAGDGHALVFLRLPLGRDTGRARIAAELGIGGHMQAGQWAPMYRASVAWGRGLSLRRANGWAQIEAAVEHRTGAGSPLYKLDVTIGQSDGARVRPMLGLGLSGGSGRPLEWTGTAALLIDGGKKTTWIVGAEAKRRPAGLALGLTLGLWRNF